ncbi:DUF4303 domain-containing protein [Chitinimonas lacunae]|uniref:DUF4303 domain-containing protein n=1 Tax=Chitinimonas lacunae TaxID=1963018 RepID=A0ABV8MTV2_9NEIS
MAASLKPYLDRLDFQPMETVLSAGIRECIENVARDHPGEEFVGFALDCNFSVGSIFFSLASTGYLSSIAAQAGMDMEAAASAPSLQERFWSLGDWPLYCVNDRYAPTFVQAWKPWESLIEIVGYNELYQQTLDADLSAAFNAHLANWAASVLVECESSGAFHTIARADAVRLIVLDHDEELNVGLDRMERSKQ